jgi:hypothetical protein
MNNNEVCETGKAGFEKTDIAFGRNVTFLKYHLRTFI